METPFTVRRDSGLRNQHDHTGLSHGAADVAVAFLEAFRLTGEEMFATGARNAMRYEDCWLDVGKATGRTSGRTRPTAAPAPS